jgi:hypothetical protein
LNSYREVLEEVESRLGTPSRFVAYISNNPADFERYIKEEIGIENVIKMKNMRCDYSFGDDRTKYSTIIMAYDVKKIKGTTFRKYIVGDWRIRHG